MGRKLEKEGKQKMMRNTTNRKQDDLIVCGVLGTLFLMWIVFSIVDVNIHNANLNTNTYSILNFFEFWGRIF